MAKEKACPGPRPVVKFLVDVFDETGETVAIATIFDHRSWTNPPERS